MLLQDACRIRRVSLRGALPDATWCVALEWMSASRWLPARRWQRWALGTLAVIAILAVAVSYLLDEPLRRRIEAGINRSLRGYKVTIGRVDFHPFGFSLDLEDSIIVQDAHPDPPMAEVPRLSASVEWRSLLQSELVADFQIVEPKIHFDQKQGQKELEDSTPLHQRGWQQAAQEIYPLDINEVNVVRGEITYRPEGNFQPLHLRDVNLRAANIRNIRSREREYPSELHLEAVVFENGRLRADGNADFLAEPHAGIDSEIEIDRIPLAYLTGVIHDYAHIRKGALSAKGEIEYAPRIQRVELDKVAVVGADADYVLTHKNQETSEQLREGAIQGAKDVSNDPTLQLRAKRVHFADSTIGWIDRTGKSDYRLFVSGLDLTLADFSNQKKDGIGRLAAKGRFNGTGPASLEGVFRPQTKSPDFDLAVRVEDADLRDMNDLLEAKAGIDVARGSLSYYSELKARNNAIDGYVKVLFNDLDVYSPAQDENKPLPKKTKEMVADALAKVLENRRTDEVATKASISGPLENPNADTWQILARLVQNAFFKAIVPGLDRDVDDAGIWSVANRKAALEESRSDVSAPPRRPH
jgi:hypothetical protein